MGLRPNSCYRGTHKPYTRTSAKVQAKDYITGIPGSKISQYEMGKKGGDFDVRISIVARAKGTVRHNTLEAMRIVASRHLQKIGPVNFFFKIPNYPHHIMRENPMATGAGADRFSQGMRASFGRPVGRASLLGAGDIIAFVDTTKKYLLPAKDAMRRACYKLGIPTRVNLHELSKEEQKILQQQAAKKVREAVVEEAPAPEAEVKEGEEKAADEKAATDGDATKKDAKEAPAEEKTPEKEKKK